MKYEYLESTLENNTLHFSSPALFNDFFDTLTAIDLSSNSNSTAWGKQINLIMVKASKTYVLSLSTNPRNWVMWNMYTVDENKKKCVFNEMKENSKKKDVYDMLRDDEMEENSKKKGVYDIFGVCLGFETAEKTGCENGHGLIFLDSNDGCVYLPSNKVEYEEEFVQIHKIDPNNNEKELLSSDELVELLTHKSDYWEKEKEERIVLIPENPQNFDGKFKCGKEKFDSGYKELPDALDIPFRKENLREVIFGYRTSESRKKHVKCLLECLGYKEIKYKEVVDKKSDNAQKIYFDLLDLWSDVFTMNYDILLERINSLRSIIDEYEW